MPYDKPLPKLNADNRAFWEGCRNHELRFQKCADCGHVRWPASDLCPRCHSTEITWLVSRGTGRVYTYAVYHTAYHPGFAAGLPYTVAVVALDEGPHLLTNIVGCRGDEVACDMLVEVVWEDVGNGFTLPKFRPLSRDRS
jgi:hypothetical protein